MVKRYDVLKMLYEKPQLYLKDVEPEKPKDFKAVAKQLGIEGYVRTPVSLSGAYSLTERGRALYLNMEELKETLEKSSDSQTCKEAGAQTALDGRKKFLNKIPGIVKIVAAVISFAASLIAVIQFLL